MVQGFTLKLSFSLFLALLFTFHADLNASERCVEVFDQPFASEAEIQNHIQATLKLHGDFEALKLKIDEFRSRFEITLQNSGIAFEKAFVPQGQILRLTGTGTTQADRLVRRLKQNYGTEVVFVPEIYFTGGLASFDPDNNRLFMPSRILFTPNAIDDATLHEVIHTELVQQRRDGRGSWINAPIHIHAMAQGGLLPGGGTEPTLYHQNFYFEELVTHAYQTSRAGRRGDVDEVKLMIPRLKMMAEMAMATAEKALANIELNPYFRTANRAGVTWLPVFFPLDNGQAGMVWIYMNPDQVTMDSSQEELVRYARRSLQEALAFAQFNRLLYVAIAQDLAAGDLAVAMEKAQNLRNAQRRFFSQRSN